jgi:hypothetical protein
VKVVCVDFDSFTFIFHLLSHASMRLRCSCRCEEAVTGLSWVAKITVSSANVPIVVSLLWVGRMCRECIVVGLVSFLGAPLSGLVDN